MYKNLLFAVSLLILNNYVEGSSLSPEKYINKIILRYRRDIDKEFNVSKGEDLPKVEEGLKLERKRPLTKIDWREIEELWDLYEDDETVTHKWLEHEKKVQNAIKEILKILFPRVISMSAQIKLSGNCSAGMLKWLVSLKQLKDWSVKMLDSAGKPTSGTLLGSPTMFGNYRECTNIRVMDDDGEDEEDDEIFEDYGFEKEEPKEFFRGKYCVLEFKPWLPKKPPFYGLSTKLKAFESFEQGDKANSVLKDLSKVAVFLNFVPFRVDLCMPSLCSVDDIQKVVNFITKAIDIRGRVTRCEMEEDSFPTLSASQASAIVVFVFLLFIFGLVTCLSIFLNQNCTKDSLFKYLKSISWITASKELLSTKAYMSRKQLAPLYGLRTIILIYIIITHLSIEVNYGFFRNVLWIKEIALSWPAQILTKSSYQFDAFILISAFSMSYVVGNTGALGALKYTLRKYLRIMPAVMIGVGFTVLLPLTRSLWYGGSTWKDFVAKPAANCESNGLFNLIFLQNFLDPSQMCIRNSWIFCVELQLGLLSIPFLALARKNLKIFLSSTLLLYVIVGAIVNILTVKNNQLPPLLIWTIPDPDQRNFYYAVHYFKPWTHLSVFGIGICAGQLSFNRNRKTNLSSTYSFAFLSLLFWSASIITLLALLYSYYDWVLGIFPSALESGLFDAGHRILLALSMGWIMYSLTASGKSKQQSFFVKLLSQPLLFILGHLSLVAYIIHPLVQTVFLGSQESQLFPSPILMIYSLFGNISFTYFLSTTISIFLEIPISMTLISRSHTTIEPEKEVKEENFNNNMKTLKICSASGNIGLNKIIN